MARVDRIDSQLLAMAQRMDEATGVVTEPAGQPVNVEEQQKVEAVVAELSKMQFMTEGVTPKLLRMALLKVIGLRPIATVLRGTPLEAARRIALMPEFDAVLASVVKAEAARGETEVETEVEASTEGEGEGESEHETEGSAG